MTTVSAPASSANLGPGFDVLGIALSRYTWVSDDGDGEPCGPDHIARVAYEAAGGESPIWFNFDLPPGRGLGFSASARAAGAVLAYAQKGLAPDDAQHEGYRVVAELEGHGDNAAPAVFGGLHIIAGDVRHRIAAEIPGTILCWVPENATTPTDENRACMPTMVDRADAVFNLGRLGLLMAALYEGRGDLLRTATEDRLHQPDRLGASAPSALAIDRAVAAGALGAWLSGSGPTVAIIADDESIDDVVGSLPDGGEVLQLEVDQTGATIVD